MPWLRGSCLANSFFFFKPHKMKYLLLLQKKSLKKAYKICALPFWSFKNLDSSHQCKNCVTQKLKKCKTNSLVDFINSLNTAKHTCIHFSGTPLLIQSLLNSNFTESEIHLKSTWNEFEKCENPYFENVLQFED